MPSFWPFAATSSTSSRPSTDSVQDASTGSVDSGSAASIPPLIICEGFLSAAQSVVWGNEFRTYLGVGHQQLVDQASPLSSPRSRRSGLGSSRAVVFAPIGPVSSLHDRACELFYALRGGTVDYGAEHAREHRHSRFGRHYAQPLCPTWGPSNGTPGLPAHFLGHSLGGPTILKLQQLLRQGFFDTALGLPSTDAGAWKAQDMVLSVTSVSSPFRGTPLVYSLGSEPLPYPKVRMFSFGDMLSKLIHIAAWLDLPFDVHADAWHFSARRKAIRRSQIAADTAAPAPAPETPADPQAGSKMDWTTQDEASGVREFLRQLWRSDWAGGRDCAPWDCTFAERDQDRAEDGWGLDIDPSRGGRTWYRSYAGGMTVPEASSAEAGPSYHRPETYWSLSPLTLTAHLIGHFDYSRLQPTPSFLSAAEKSDGDDVQARVAELSSAWWQNDGVVPLASQFHPLDCDPTRCTHFNGMPASLPFGTRKKRPQSTDLRPSVAGSQEQELLPVPATQARKTKSMLGSATSAARIAFSTSLRALGDDPPLVTPSEEDLRSFLPNLPPSEAIQATAEAVDTNADHSVQTDLVQPAPNRWYTFEIDGLDHTSLCPFWTGSEVQKQFWTGMGFFLASVDRQTGFSTHDIHKRTA
ncbi:hypothetical protein PANT_9d00380 [Moesziomyces antarcticus T-34]|uniref:Lipase-like C-terminal domain-containing protein n=1 Tax=Pseudozyma antarctica (strain T-34) TaxID=1151754 RepID=M9LPG1_PSEA3|nr:hypothetical protein PANT_9d00380 [Moesziomyces antarcticus T-34]